MKITVLDSFAANPGDLSWDALAELGEVSLYDRTAPEEVVPRSIDAEALLLNKVRMTRQVIAALPKLRYIGVLATGYNVVDLAAAREYGIVVCNVPAYSTMSVAQMVFAHLLNITNSVAHYSEKVRAGHWAESKDFCFYSSPLMELSGRTMGIVGMGNTGTAVARMAQAFGMDVLAMSSKSEETLHDMGVAKAASYEELFGKSDVLSLHCPLTDGTRHLVNAGRLAMMKPSAIVINTGRGPLVDEQALADALNAGRLYAAGVDVLSQEPPQRDNVLVGARNLHVTPHVAWATAEARQRLLAVAIENVKAFAEGNPKNIVS
ncbi:MAG: D-2-hydroxyacid dehydrogenase [Bacteroidaceae bacterium]|nr:D-2-hydroxyacid dehydrogenase [Bacteroidaceae bacterium]